LQALAVAIKLRGDHRKVKKDPVLKEYNNVFEQLTVSNDGLILRMHQIVIPKSLCSSLVDIAHEGHLGIVKTKQLMRFKFWFPRLDSLVEARIGNCMACQSYTPANSNNMVPLQSEPVPTSVLDTVAGDFFGPLPSGHYLISFVCKTSGYSIVEVVTSTSAKANIPIIDRIFSELGIPSVFCSDNGPHFQSRDFKDYCEYLGMKHTRATPYWPRGNSKCERFMKSLGKMVRCAQVEGKPWREAMNQFLRTYSAAPHGSNKFSPNQLMFGRNLSSRLPTAMQLTSSATLESALDNYSKAAERNREYGITQSLQPSNQEAWC